MVIYVMRCKTVLIANIYKIQARLNELHWSVERAFEE